jgi:hypothetical protein
LRFHPSIPLSPESRNAGVFRSGLSARGHCTYDSNHLFGHTPELDWMYSSEFSSKVLLYEDLCFGISPSQLRLFLLISFSFSSMAIALSVPVAAANGREA